MAKDRGGRPERSWRSGSSSSRQEVTPDARILGPLSTPTSSPYFFFLFSRMDVLLVILSPSYCDFFFV